MVRTIVIIPTAIAGRAVNTVVVAANEDADTVTIPVTMTTMEATTKTTTAVTTTVATAAATMAATTAAAATMSESNTTACEQ
jgi:hypothetical protein